MDVVKSEIAALGGRVELSSETGRGTKFTIYLPLTLAVTQAVMVRAGGVTFAIPAVMVEQVRQVKRDELAAFQTSGEAQWQNRRYPFRYLPRLLGDGEFEAEARRVTPVMFVRTGPNMAAIQLDEIMGSQEIVVKNTGPLLARVAGITGATVLGTGEIVLIINPVILAGREPSAESRTAAGPGAAPVAAAPAAPVVPTVMIVDDSLTVRKITGRLLAREGYNVLTAKDGVDAMEQLQDDGAGRDARRHRDAADGRLRPHAQRARGLAPEAHPDHHDHLAHRGQAPRVREGDRRQRLPRQAVPGRRAARAHRRLRPEAGARLAGPPAAGTRRRGSSPVGMPPGMRRQDSGTAARSTIRSVSRVDLTDHFLIAMPNMADPYFSRTLTFICEHNEQGALGVVVNRPIDMTLAALFERLNLETGARGLAETPVYFGGPVQTDRGFVLHAPIGKWSSTLPVHDRLGLTTSRDILEAVSHGDGPARMLLTLGYSGWAAGQLEHEIKQNAWLTVAAQDSIIFDVPAEERLPAAMELLGVSYATLADEAGHA